MSEIDRDDLLLICVNYQSDTQSRKFIEHFFSDLKETKQERDVNVVLVANGAPSLTDDRFANLALKFPNLMIVNSVDNLGYFGGAAKGFEAFMTARGTSARIPKWVIVSNTDIVLSGLVSSLRNLLPNTTRGAGVIAPSIISELDTFDQNPYMTDRPSVWKMHGYKWIFRFLPVSKTYHYLSHFKKILKQHLPFLFKKQNYELGSNPSEAIYAAHGAFLIFAREYFEKGGSLKYPSFLFGEEIFVAEQVAKLHLKILYLPQLRVLHSEHITTGLVPNRQLLRYLGRSSAFCANHYFPLPWHSDRTN